MALNSLFCADVPLSNYSLTPDLYRQPTSTEPG